MDFQKIKSILPPLLALFIVTNGLVLFATFIPVKLEYIGVSSWEIGLVTTAYYLGMTLGAFRNANFIIRVGHIRAFAAFASIISAVTLISGIFYSIWLWVIFRIVLGYCLAGLYIVIESWILKEGTAKTRGQFLALYMISLYSASASGHLLLNFCTLDTLIPFVIIAVLASLSVIPLAITKVGNPIIEKPSALTFLELFKLSPSGLISCFIAGFLLSTINGLLPLYLIEHVDDISEIAFGMFLVLMGGMLLQYPIGKISDIIDRRIILLVLCVTVSLISLCILILPLDNLLVFYTLMFVFGGASFAVYPVSMSLTCDVLEQDDIVSGTQGLILIYSIGSVLGPILATISMNLFGNVGIFTYFLVSCAGLGLYLAQRIMVSKAHTTEEHQAFVSMPNTTPIASEMDPRSDD